MGNQRSKIASYNLPENIQIHVKIAVRQAVPGPGYFLPAYFGIPLLGLLRNMREASPSISSKRVNAKVS